LAVDCGTGDDDVTRGGVDELTGGEAEATCGFDGFSFFGVLVADPLAPPAGFRVFLSRSAVILNDPEATGAVFGLSFAFD
jgi:hypothetical protein